MHLLPVVLRIWTNTLKTRFLVNRLDCVSTQVSRIAQEYASALCLGDPVIIAMPTPPLYLQVYDGSDTSSSLLVSATGIYLESFTVRGTGNQLFLRMTSDFAMSSPGFDAVYNAGTSVWKMKFRNIKFGLVP